MKDEPGINVLQLRDERGDALAALWSIRELLAKLVYVLDQNVNFSEAQIFDD